MRVPVLTLGLWLGGSVLAAGGCTVPYGLPAEPSPNPSFRLLGLTMEVYEQDRLVVDVTTATVFIHDERYLRSPGPVVWRSRAQGDLSAR